MEHLAENGLGGVISFICIHRITAQFAPFVFLEVCNSITTSLLLVSSVSTLSANNCDYDYNLTSVVKGTIGDLPRRCYLTPPTLTSVGGGYELASD